MTYHITAFYFLGPRALENHTLQAWRAAYLQLKNQYPELCGTLILAPDGINATVAGSLPAVEQLEQDTTARWQELFPKGSYGGGLYKRSQHPVAPFGRFKVQLRRETITSGSMHPFLEDPSGATHLTPQEWHEKMNQANPKRVIIDTRNDYEFQVGTFRGALNPDMRIFTEFEDYAAKMQLEPDTEILAFCTGGIRCEKAVPYLKKLGFKNVYQLEGGILGYLEQFPQGHFEGDCFVFDERIAVNGQLQASGRYTRCGQCGQPLPLGQSCNECPFAQPANSAAQATATTNAHT